MSIADPPVASLMPTHLDLPETDGKPVENTYQPYQSALLSGILIPVLERLHPDGNFHAAADNGIYWRMTKDPLEGVRAPDWYYVANVPRLLDGELRRSYVMWQEIESPLIAIEYVSGDGSEEHDQTPYRGKFWVYERGIKAAYYVIWDPFRVQLEVFELIRNRYQPVPPTEAGRFRIPPMEVDFGIWEGTYLGVPASWLRAWDWYGRLIPTPEEATDRERQRAEHEKQRAEHEKQRAEKLAAKLRELGVNPDAI